MFENIINFFKNIGKKDNKEQSSSNSKNAAKERLHLVLMQDRANVSADFLELMKQEIIDVIKKYIEIDEKEIDVRLTNKENEDGTNGAPALYANIPILNIKNESRKIAKQEKQEKQEEKQEEKLQEDVKEEKQQKEETATSDEIEEEVQEKIKVVEEIIEEVQNESQKEKQEDNVKTDNTQNEEKATTKAEEN